MLTINGATRVRSMYGFARSKSSEGISMPGGWQWTFRKWNGLRDCLRRIIRRMTRDKRSSMPATLGGKPSTMNENGLFGWRTTRVGQHSTAKTRAKIIDCKTAHRDRHSGARVPRFFPALPEEVQRLFPSFAERQSLRSLCKSFINCENTRSTAIGDRPSTSPNTTWPCMEMTGTIPCPL